MARITLEEQEEFPVLPQDSIIQVKVSEVNIQEVEGQRGSWEKMNVKFKILGVQVAGDAGPVERFENLITSDVYGGVPFRLTDHAENKLRIWVEAILGMSLGLGFELDTDYLLNRQCRAVTRVFDKRAKDSQGRPYKGHGVETLLAASGPSTQGQGLQQNPWGGGQQQAPQAGGVASGWGAPAQQPMNQGVQQGWAQPQQQQPPAQDPWGQQQPAAQPTGNPGWGGAWGGGNDDPPF